MVLNRAGPRAQNIADGSNTTHYFTHLAFFKSSANGDCFLFCHRPSHLWYLTRLIGLIFSLLCPWCGNSRWQVLKWDFYPRKRSWILHPWNEKSREFSGGNTPRFGSKATNQHLRISSSLHSFPFLRNKSTAFMCYWEGLALAQVSWLLNTVTY